MSLRSALAFSIPSMIVDASRPDSQLAVAKPAAVLTASGHDRKLAHMVEEKDLSAKIRELLGARSPTSSICPSDVARAAAPDNWRPLMEPVREAARHMVADGEVQITQGGEVVDPESVRGPIRIRWAR